MAENSVSQNNKKTGRFEKGVSGNPGGRPKIPDQVKEMFKAATPAACQLLIDMMKDEAQKPELRVDCANKIIERTYGKPTQPIDGDIDAKGLFEVMIKVVE